MVNYASFVYLRIIKVNLIFIVYVSSCIMAIKELLLVWLTILLSVKPKHMTV